MNFFQTVYNVLLKFDFEPFFRQWCCVNEPINIPTSNEHLFAMVSNFISINDKLNDHFFYLKTFYMSINIQSTQYFSPLECFFI